MRSRNLFLDAQFRNEAGTMRQAEVAQNALEEVEVVLNEPSDNGLSDQLAEFFRVWQELAGDPTDGAVRTTVIEQSAALATAFSSAANQLADIRTNLDNQVEMRVAEANSFAAQIAELNARVVQVEVSGQSANDFRDRRDLLIDKLSKLVQVQVTENADGSLNVAVSGRNFIAGNTVDNLTTVVNGSGFLDIQFSSDNAAVTPGDGELNGLINSRDVKLPKYLTALNQIAGDLITAVNALHTTGYGQDGVTGRAFFTGTDAASIAINPVVVADPRLIGVASAANQSGNNAVALAIAQLRHTMSPKPEDAFGALIAEVGIDAQEARSTAENQQVLVSLLERRRDEVSGVSLDEEAVMMVRYQRAYEAASRMITAVDEMLDVLINRTGMVGR
jgi:flagellar hook-associated protein 1 FlgK